MPEISPDSLLSHFYAKLRQELTVEGVPADRLTAIVQEVRSHLEEAIEVEDAVNADQIRKVLQDFGNERSLARSLAAEYRHGASKRIFLWPAVTTIALLAVFFLIANSRIWLFGRQIWIGTLFLIASAVALAIIGYVARRPSVGQFAALAAALVISCTLGFAVTSYPVNHSSDGHSGWYSPTFRWSVSQDIDSTHRFMSAHQEVSRRISIGKQVFADSNPRPVPDFLQCRAGYLLPEGVRESALGYPVKGLYSLLATPSFEVAVEQWNRRIDFADGPKTEADFILSGMPKDIAALQRSIDDLAWIQKQPLTVQIARDFSMVWPGCLAVCLSAFLATNVGWAVWMLVWTAGRQIRRRSNGLGA
jgi:hypothetical protein